MHAHPIFNKIRVCYFVLEDKSIGLLECYFSSYLQCWTVKTLRVKLAAHLLSADFRLPAYGQMKNVLWTPPWTVWLSVGPCRLMGYS